MTQNQKVKVASTEAESGCESNTVWSISQISNTLGPPLSLFVDTTQPHQVNLSLVNFICEKQTQDVVWIYLTQATETLV